MEGTASAPSPESLDYTKVDRLLEKIEKEFSFLKAGEDGGQLPIRDQIGRAHV